MRNMWGGSGSALLRDRLADLVAIHNRMFHRLLGKVPDEFWSAATDEQIIVVAKLSPGLTVQLDRDHVVGLGGVRKAPRPPTRRSPWPTRRGSRR